MRYILLFLYQVISIALLSQCNVIRHHPLYPDTLGMAYVNTCDVDGLLWDDGSTDGSVTLSVGPHWLVRMNDGVVIDTVHFDILQLNWGLGQNVYTLGGLVAVSVIADVPFCGNQIYDWPTCMPDPSTTTIRLLQDGIPIDSIAQVSCLYTFEEWLLLPFGHTYQTQLIDVGCASSVNGDVIQTFMIGEPELELEITEGTGSNSIEVLQVLPSSYSPEPVDSLLSGSFALFQHPDGHPNGEPQNGMNAIWTNVASGEYTILFTPDLVAPPIGVQVSIGGATSMLEEIDQEELFIWPNPAEDFVDLSRVCEKIHVMDPLGRILITANNTSRIETRNLAGGHYIIMIGDGRRMSFIKE